MDDEKINFRTWADDVLFEYADAYYAYNGFPAHLRLLRSGRYEVDGSKIHKGKPIVVDAHGYSLSELPNMTKNLWSHVNFRKHRKMRELVHQLMPIPIRKVINRD